MSLSFTKMHGLGNDYVFISLFDQAVDDAPALARAISDRHCGVGSDGLILVAPPTAPAAHVRMIMYNADGSRAQMCGNGIRCLAKLAYERGLACANPLRVETDAGVLALDLTLDAHEHVTQVRVDMGEPILDPRRIPVAVEARRVVAYPFVLGSTKLPLTCVSVGNPHAVFFVPDVACVPLTQWGPQVERHPLFPARINVHFVQVITPELVHMVTWERGAGATQACGTGASAVCVAGVLNGLTRRAITAELPGGALKLEWDETSNDVYMSGPAVEVFTGVWPM
jgi:diaminopimelate epimerase